MGIDTDLLEARPAYGLIQESANFSEEKMLTKEELARSYYLMAKVQYDKADFVKADTNFQKALSLAERPKDVYTIFKTLGFLITISS